MRTIFVGMLLRSVIISCVAFFLVGCIVDESDSDSIDTSPVGAEAGPFTRSDFSGYEMVPQFRLSYRPPFPNDVVFHQVSTLAGGNAFLYLRPLIVSPGPLKVTIDETIENEFLLSGTAVMTVTSERCGGEKEKADCWSLSDAEVIFQTSAGADAFNAALLAVRTTP